LGVQFVGYILAKLLGARRGIGLIGLLGGLVSSTAVTLSFTQRSRNEPAHSDSLSLAILASWCVMLARTLAVVFALNPQVLQMAWAPLSAALVAGLGFCLFLFLRPRQAAEAEAGLFENPFELGPALRFGLLFVVILVAARWAQTAFGNLGMYLSSFMAGLLDVDAISFTMSRMANQGGIDAASAANALLLAALANTLLKGGMSIALGSPGLRRVMAPGTVLMPQPWPHGWPKHFLPQLFSGGSAMRLTLLKRPPGSARHALGLRSASPSPENQCVRGKGDCS
jgi:uncharacterized membrane protein (DUF4010 family)